VVFLPACSYVAENLTCLTFFNTVMIVMFPELIKVLSKGNSHVLQASSSSSSLCVASMTILICCKHHHPHPLLFPCVSLWETSLSFNHPPICDPLVTIITLFCVSLSCSMYCSWFFPVFALLIHWNVLRYHPFVNVSCILNVLCWKVRWGQAVLVHSWH